jgi:hypothetical protein
LEVSIASHPLLAMKTYQDRSNTSGAKRRERSRGVSGGKRGQERRERRGGSGVGRGGLRHVSIVHYGRLTTVSQLTADEAEDAKLGTETAERAAAAPRAGPDD